MLRQSNHTHNVYHITMVITNTYREFTIRRVARHTF